jgi:hypothetical protein
MECKEMSDVWGKVKAAAKWIWNWVTVLVAMIVGMLSIGLDWVSQLAGVDLTQIMTERRAAQVTFGVAITKAVVATYNAQKAKT